MKRIWYISKIKTEWKEDEREGSKCETDGEKEVGSQALVISRKDCNGNI